MYEPLGKFTKLHLAIVIILGISFSAVVIHLTLLSMQHYYTPSEGAPDGVYLQGDWGYVDSVSFPSTGGWIKNATTWSFALCDHEGLGPLHGTWPVANGTLIPIYGQGIFPYDARLYITIKNNTIVSADIHSQFEYGN